MLPTAIQIHPIKIHPIFSALALLWLRWRCLVSLGEELDAFLLYWPSHPMIFLTLTARLFATNALKECWNMLDGLQGRCLFTIDRLFAGLFSL